MGAFIPNPVFARTALRSASVKEKLLDLAQRGAEIASQHAPDDPATGPGEDLAGSIVGEVVLTDEGFRGRITARNYKGLFKEFGTSLEAPQPFLRPALEELGLDVTDDGRRDG